MLALITLLTSMAVALATPLDLETRQEPPKDTVYIVPGLGCGQNPLPKVATTSGGPVAPVPDGNTLFVSTGARYVIGYWTMPAGGQGQIKLTGTNKCIDAGLNPANGVVLKEWECYDVPQQQWKFHDNKIQLVGSNLCFDVKDGNLKGDVQLWQCYDGNPNQMFYTQSIFNS